MILECRLKLCDTVKIVHLGYGTNLVYKLSNKSARIAHCVTGARTIKPDKSEEWAGRFYCTVAYVCPSVFDHQ